MSPKLAQTLDEGADDMSPKLSQTLDEGQVIS